MSREKRAQNRRLGDMEEEAAETTVSHPEEAEEMEAGELSSRAKSRTSARKADGKMPQLIQDGEQLLLTTTNAWAHPMLVMVAEIEAVAEEVVEEERLADPEPASSAVKKATSPESAQTLAKEVVTAVANPELATNAVKMVTWPESVLILAKITAEAPSLEAEVEVTLVDQEPASSVDKKVTSLVSVQTMLEGETATTDPRSATTAKEKATSQETAQSPRKSETTAGKEVVTKDSAETTMTVASEEVMPQNGTSKQRQVVGTTKAALSKMVVGAATKLLKETTTGVVATTSHLNKIKAGATVANQHKPNQLLKATQANGVQVATARVRIKAAGDQEG